MNILISGSLVYDRIMDFPGLFKDHILPDKIHNLNVSFLINGLKENFGGTAGNIAYGLSLLGEKPYILATAGKDFAPYEKWLIKHKVNLSELKIIKKVHTAGAYIMTDKTDNQITGFNPGAMFLSRGRFTPSILNGSLATISPGNLDDMDKYARLYQKKKVRYIFDPGQSIPALAPAVLENGIKGAEIVIGNDYEIEMIKEKIGWTAKQLESAVKTLIVTKGGKGAEILEGGKRHIIKTAKAKKVVDPTGAGDAFRAGLIKGLVNGWNLLRSAKLAAVVASYSVEEYGGQGYRFTNQDIKRRFKHNFNENL